MKEKKKAKVKVAPRYQMRLETTDLKSLLVTIDMIWQCNGRLLSSARDPDGRLKDICLSYALYGKIPAEDMEVWDGLPSKEVDDHVRAFWVIEVELAFLYDLFYTTYPIFFANVLQWLRNLELVIVIISCWTVLDCLIFCK